MSRFEHGLRRAQARQRYIYLLTAGAIVALGLVVGTTLMLGRGTAVEVVPAEADADVQVADGLAAVVDDTLYSLSASPTIVVRAEGYREQRRTVRPAERGGSIRVTMVELPGTLVGAVTPASVETRWLLDDELLTVGPTFERQLDAGTYSLAVDNRFFQPVTRKIAIKRGAAQEVEIALQPIVGRLVLAADAADARISVDGVPVGTGRVEHEVQGGIHAIRVESEDRVPIEETVEITHAAPQVERNYRLQLQSATLTVETDPPGGQLLLDGRAVQPGRDLPVTATARHTLSYLLDGHHGATETVVLQAGERRQVTLRLAREMGTVEIHAAPSATVLIDGAEAGTGKVVLSLQAVPHRIELRRPGYRTVVRSVTPTSKRKTVVRERLVPELAARLAESPREYTNGVGIALKLFEPGAFVMGAPRHQQGQRANEFEKKVVLKKAFYAARHEVTNQQFRAFRQQHAGPDNQPAVAIGWLDAAAFCNWLSDREGRKPVYRIEGGRLTGVDARADGYRLLTEAEWEWLARQAGKSRQTVFPWGDNSVVPRMAGNIADESANGLTATYVPNYNDGHAGVAAVGSFPAEASGLFDLAGNVSEWVHDRYSLEPPPPGEVQVDPMGPEYGDVHVVKGASWRSGTRTLLRAAYRDGLIATRDDVGFRIGRYLYGAEDTRAN